MLTLKIELESDTVSSLSLMLDAISERLQQGYTSGEGFDLQGEEGTDEGERDQSRYLTKEELEQLADDVPEGELAEYLLSDEHQQASGLCFEVLLTRGEARDVDASCEALGIGQG
jgi:hypothetical protein